MRIHVTFSKTGPLVYIGNLDLLTIWERAARRAGLPLSYTRAFHPQPKIHMAAPLPLGFSSRSEVLDMRLNETVDVYGLGARMQAVLPSGIAVLHICEADAGAPALQAAVRAAEYEISLRTAVETADLERRVDRLLMAPALPRVRRGKSYDLRPLIDDLHVVPSVPTSQPQIRMRLSAREGATGRPDEVLDSLGLRREDARIERTALIFEN
jgi:radical SAM-linked protein